MKLVLVLCVVCVAADITYTTKQVDWNAPFTHVYGEQAVSVNNTIFVLGGFAPGPQSGVWWSPDGANWSNVPTTNLPPRGNFGFQTVGDTMVVVAGSPICNDVWISQDGVNWIQQTANAAFPPREDPMLLQLSGSLYVVGGNTASGIASDMWQSSDLGASWSLVPNTNFPPLLSGFVATMGKTAYLMGGSNNYYCNPQTATRSVWSSSNGVQWTMTTAPWPARCSAVAQASSSVMVVAGGWNGQTDINDMWATTDGVTWTQLNSPPWSPRDQAASAVVSSSTLSVFIISGLPTGDPTKPTGDVWEFTLQLGPNCVDKISALQTQVQALSKSLSDIAVQLSDVSEALYELQFNGPCVGH